MKRLMCGLTVLTLLLSAALPCAAATTVLLGDVDENGAVNTTDARRILQYAAQHIGGGELTLATADVNEDGLVNTTDARFALQIAAGMRELTYQTPLAVLSEKTLDAKSDGNRLMRTRAELDSFLADNDAIAPEDVAEFDDAFFAAHSLVQLSTAIGDDWQKTVACGMGVQSLHVVNDALWVEATFHSAWECDNYNRAVTLLLTVDKVEKPCDVTLHARYALPDALDAVHESRLAVSTTGNMWSEDTALVIESRVALQAARDTLGERLVRAVPAQVEARYPTGLLPDWLDLPLCNEFIDRHGDAFFEDNVLVLVSGGDGNLETFVGLRDNADGSVTVRVRRAAHGGQAGSVGRPTVLAVEISRSMLEGKTVSGVEIIR